MTTKIEWTERTWNPIADCTHFSRAKGGKPREKKIRGLAWVVVRWAKRVKPRVIVCENVAEFQTWGPLLADDDAASLGDPAARADTLDRIYNIATLVDDKQDYIDIHGEITNYKPSGAKPIVLHVEVANTIGNRIALARVGTGNGVLVRGTAAEEQMELV